MPVHMKPVAPRKIASAIDMSTRRRIDRQRSAEIAERTREQELAEAQREVEMAVRDANAALCQVMDPAEVEALTARGGRR